MKQYQDTKYKENDTNIQKCISETQHSVSYAENHIKGRFCSKQNINEQVVYMEKDSIKNFIAVRKELTAYKFGKSVLGQAVKATAEKHGLSKSAFEEIANSRDKNELIGYLLINTSVSSENKAQLEEQLTTETENTATELSEVTA